MAGGRRIAISLLHPRPPRKRERCGREGTEKVYPVEFEDYSTGAKTNPEDPACPVKFEDHFPGVDPACPEGAKHRTGVKPRIDSADEKDIYLVSIVPLHDPFSRRHHQLIKTNS